MKRNHIRITASVLAAAMLFSFAACGKSEDPLSEPPAAATTTTAAPATTAAPVGYTNLLTGEDVLTTTKNRPVAFMIDNYSTGIRQKNIDKADFYVEAETEGGIPRIMAVFGSVERVPAEVGPVRSARTHFVKMAKALDAVYCHVGGSTLGRAMIREKKLTDLDSLVQVSGELKAANGASEHTKVFTLSKIQDAVKKRGISTTTATASPYTFGEKAGSGAGNSVQINVSSSWKISFAYDAATKLYTKHRTTLSSPAHVSYDGDAIRVSNVIILYDARFWEDSGHISFPLSGGKGVLVSGGTSRNIRWSRTDKALKFTEEDGSPLTVAKGKTYVCLTDNSNASKTVLQ